MLHPVVHIPMKWPLVQRLAPPMRRDGDETKRETSCWGQNSKERSPPPRSIFRFDAMCKRHGHDVDVFREGYQQLFEAAMASIESAEVARKRADQLTAELTGHREKLVNLETYEEDAKSSQANLLVRF